MNLPAAFLETIDLPELKGLAETLATTGPSVSVRLNPAKQTVDKPFADARTVAWCDAGRYLDARPQFTFDPLMHQGAYYVQEASSMITARVASQLAGETGRPLAWLDACAAPGGKTTAAISSLPEGSLVVANEYMPQRAAILAENLAKWGFADAVVTTGDTRRLSPLRESFDVIAVDAPCSGEGMMRKDTTAVEQWSPGLVKECAARQREIVANLWPALRPGGFMIYSTCTFNRTENEEMVEWIIDEYGAESVDMHPDPAWGIIPGIDTGAACMRFIPGRTEGEGLFMAVLRKPGTLTPELPKPHRPKGKLKTEMLLHPERFDLLTDPDGTVRAMPLNPLLPQKLTSFCRPVLTLGTMKGRDLIPSQQLALSLELRRDRFPRVDVDLDQAITYLRREAIELPEGTPRGFVLLYHQGLPLGFVKNLGNRSNNLYPQPWRILSRR